ncbi:single-stranded DNA-binding protein [Clostridium sp. DJ247]|uniref:single-stranded DNA-binding protein n=1 Tax=Clostridium sp. DJ247 TaxID=2726188 RepID=UPI0016276098|nr:single-stranded DNA-binding protein [Clostridium sp. DJ247]MBC2582117.1 single-stranded DNA-binding protein [Clostridium sp. DJ247]
MNKVMLIGRLTKDAEIVKLENSDRGVIKFTVAVNKNIPNKDKENAADFISVAYWSNYGDKIQPYLTKGKLIGVSGKISTRSYVANDGIKKYITQVEADNIQFLEVKKENVI